MSFQNPSDVMHILFTTNTSAIAAVLTSTIASWIVIGKPDLGMTINGCLAGLVGVTGSCAYVTIEVSLLIGAVAGVLVVFLVGFFDKLKIDDPVGATSVHLGCGIFGTLCVGLFAKEGVTSLSTANGLFYGGGFGLLGVELLGIVSVGAFVFVSSSIIWLVLKKTCGIRVSREEELAGLDVGEHGNIAYPDFAPATGLSEERYGDEMAEKIAAGVREAVAAEAGGGGGGPASSDDVPGGSAEAVPSGGVPAEEAAAAVFAPKTGGKMTKVTIIANQTKFAELQDALEKLGVTGITITNVFGHGMQKGHQAYFRGAPIETRLLPKVKIDIVVSKIPTEVLVDTVQKVLYTGNVGDGKIFVYDVEDVIKVRTGEHGYDALQDET